MKRAGLSLLMLASAGCFHAPAAPSPSPASYSPEDVRYFQENRLMVPVDGVPPDELRDSFGAARGGGRAHRAIDIMAPRGTPVVAAIDGIVLRLSQSAAGGITAYLVDSEGRYIYYYAHLERYSAPITPGLAVSQGFVIGYVGTSGNAPPDTPHLHFQVMRPNAGQRDWWNGTPVDVRSFITRTGKARK